MSETWLEKREWERLKERLPRGYEWEIQLARRKNRKGRVIRGITNYHWDQERSGSTGGRRGEGDGENNDGGEDRWGNGE